MFSPSPGYRNGQGHSIQNRDAVQAYRTEENAPWGPQGGRARNEEGKSKGSNSHATPNVKNNSIFSITYPFHPGIKKV
jgi:hypothetical protein